MALLSCPAPMLIGDSCLKDWQVIGSGGFGQIYKARHCMWCCDVAVKLLHYDDGTSSSLLREIDMMRQGSSPYVIQVLGVFKGRLPHSGPSAHLGLVMEFMERGSLATLQEMLCGAPPWPLVVRLAHQVALGINFLHKLSPALLHLDLKPSNVLLDSSLNAKLTDFGLAKFYHSVTRTSKCGGGEEGGTISYMPPEAFGICYSPTRASDIYSYGVLLWSIVTGKQPYEHALSSIVRLRIPQGDRPSLDDIRGLAAGLTGLTGLMELMEKCWDARPTERPSSHYCTTVTEELYKMHKHSIHDTVHQVLKELARKEDDKLTQQVLGVQIPPIYGGVDNVLTGPPPVQEIADSLTPNQRDEPQVKGCSPAGCKARPSSVYPIHLSPSSPATPAAERSPQDRATKPTHLPPPQNSFQQYQRQLSSPGTFPYHGPRAPRICIQFSNASGIQLGDNNSMEIFHSFDSLERKRHPTAPSRVNLSPPHSGSLKNKRGGVG